MPSLSQVALVALFSSCALVNAAPEPAYTVTVNNQVTEFDLPPFPTSVGSDAASAVSSVVSDVASAVSSVVASASEIVASASSEVASASSAVDSAISSGTTVAVTAASQATTFVLPTFPTGGIIGTGSGGLANATGIGAGSGAGSPGPSGTPAPFTGAASSIVRNTGIAAVMACVAAALML
ncbi:MAG: hypothetical protein M1825_001625 [Sarcosagium campestre]|nr:MAG: hypothetical protein M1825_001625 [Sarcosagium campestre]